MRRRDFLKSAATVSMLLASPVGLSRRSRAQSADDPLWIMIDARGGWDPTCLMDPKGGEPFNSMFLEADIQSSGQLRWAPRDKVGSTLYGWDVGADGDRQDFFERYANDLLVINGVDTQTNSHDVGPRHTWSGNIRAGFPAFAALMAAVKEEELGSPLPMAMLSTGGFDDTAGLLPPARAGNVNALVDLSLPYRFFPTSDTNFNRYAHADEEALVAAAGAARRQRQGADAWLPQVRKAMEGLGSAREAEQAFEPLHTEFKAMRALTAAEAANPLIPKAQVALAGMAAGVCVSTMLGHGSFDTHTAHDNATTGHRLKAHELFEATDYVIRELDRLGLRERAVIVMGSDFGRTIYNSDPADAQRGKDHWPITSMMLMGRGISGGRVIGATDRGLDGQTQAKGHRAMPVKVVSGEVVTTTPSDPAGELLRPGHVHQALRTLAGLGGNAIASRFEIPDVPSSPLPLLA
jgi:uncharacterized protein (DUF1501 family)